MEAIRDVIIIFPLILASFMFLPSPVFAHDSTLVYSTMNVSLPNSVRIDMNVPQQNFKLLYANKTLDESLAAFPDYMKRSFLINDSSGRCTPSVSAQKETETVKVSALYSCGGMEFLNLSYSMFFDVSSTHENVLDIYIDEANISGRIILSEQGVYNVNIPVGDIVRSYNSRNNISANPVNNSLNITSLVFKQENTVASFFVLGIEHIFTGYDHILFIIGILLITTYFFQLTKIISSFTIAHTITLIIATLGFVALSPRITEPLIALTIVFIAAENIFILRAKSRRKKKAGRNKLTHKLFGDSAKRWRITFFLGLVHGFGFSSVLRDIGLPQNDLIPALLSFNLGVEAGQLAIVAVLFPVLIYSRRFKRQPKAILVLSAIIGIIGGFWFLQRIFF